MQVTISRLRRWFAIVAVAAVAIVAGTYFYARHRVQNALKQVPGKIGADIQRSAQGYTYSQSEEGRTVFKIQAAKAVFKLDGRAELQGVAITLYGRDAGRFDQIYGSDFEYDSKSGDVTARGEVQIDLEANPAGLTSPDQTPPKELKNPIHLKTSGLVFNQKTGNARTQQKVDFSISQASGSAVGASYVSKSGTLTLDSQVEVAFGGPEAATVTAASGTITQDPRSVVLHTVRVQEASRRGGAENATLLLAPDNTLERILASGNVRLELAGAQPTQLHADQADLVLDEDSSQLRTATFSGNVEMENSGNNPVRGSAGRVTASFSGKGQLTRVRAEENVRVLQPEQPSSGSGRAQTVQLAAPRVDFLITAGQRPTSAETFGPAQITVQPPAPTAGKTVITAGKFTAQFDQLGQLASVHGAPDVRLVSSSPGQPDHVSTSLSVDASFAPGQGMESAVQQGNVVLTDSQRQAWAGKARYTPADQMLELSGSPRVLDQNMTTTTRLFRINRGTGEAFADGDVKTTYNDLAPQPNGALLASSSPIHVTAHAMVIRRNPAVAFYTGDVRLWQDANVVVAPTIEFDRNHRSVVATGSASQPVSTVLAEKGKRGQVVPMTITAGRLIYVDAERKANYAGGITARTSDFTLTCQQMDVFLKSDRQLDKASSPVIPPPEQVGKLDRIVAQGLVVITQPGRRATGNQLTYTAPNGRFVLTGGPPSIFDAERGQITGVSLTLFRGDDRVLVEGTETSPSVTQTRVAR